MRHHQMLVINPLEVNLSMCFPFFKLKQIATLILQSVVGSDDGSLP